MKTLSILMFAFALPLRAQSICEEGIRPIELDPAVKRVIKYNAIAAGHRVKGLASYYSTSLDGTLTANGEHYWNKRLTAAHLTLPLGCWVEVTSLATGKKIRLRVNDRGPYVKKFCIDLSQAAARAIGVDIAEDRTVLIRIIGLPGESPLAEEEPLAGASVAAK